MAKLFSTHLLGAVLLATVVLVKSLPTSVLVDTKQPPQLAPISSNTDNKGMPDVINLIGFEYSRNSNLEALSNK